MVIQRAAERYNGAAATTATQADPLQTSTTLKEGDDPNNHSLKQFRDALRARWGVRDVLLDAPNQDKQRVKEHYACYRNPDRQKSPGAAARKP